jgi:hypothetical protein
LVQLIEQQQPPPPPTLLIIVRSGSEELSDSLKDVVAAAAAAAAAAASSPSSRSGSIKVCTVHVCYEDSASASAPIIALHDGDVTCKLPSACFSPSLGHGPLQLAVKLILNAVSTCAFINQGCVYGNRMINLTVSNDKLFSRAISIVSAVTSVNAAAAQHALLRSLYDRDGDTHDLKQLPVAEHVIRGSAKQGKRAVPVAIMLAMDEGLAVAQVLRLIHV